MAQAKKRTTKKKTETSDSDRLLGLVIENQERLAKAFETARERGNKISKMLSEQALQGQRDALELAKLIASHPTDYSENAKAMMEAGEKVQSRTLALAKDLYAEQVEAAESFRKSIENLVDSGREASEAFAGMGTCWTANNPVAEAWQKSIESLRN